MSTPVSGVNFAASYVPPGVYVSTKSTGSTGSVGIGDTVVCLVGRGVGYRTFTESVSFETGDTQPLTQLGINSAPVGFTINDNGLVTYDGTGSVLVTKPWSGQAPYQMDSGSTPQDYSISQTPDPTDPSNKSKFSTVIKRTPSGTISNEPGSAVLVRYQYTDASYYQLHSFTDYASFTALYGPALDPVTGEINSPLSLAAQFAMTNGASILYAAACESVDEGPPTPDEFEAAYAMTVPNYDINIMVPLWEDAGDQGSAANQMSKLRSFLDSAEGSGFPRVALCGPAVDYDLSDGSSPADVAVNVAYRRIVWLWPWKFNMFNPVLTTNGTFAVDGFYAAAAAAGFLANNDPDQGLTATSLAGFTGLPADVLASMTSFADKNTWSASGVCVYEQNRLNQIICRHGVTTDPSDAGTREISIVRCQDALFVEIELTMQEAGLIGTPITGTTVTAVKSLVTGALENALANNTIANYSGVVVAQQRLPAGDPTVIACSFNYQPTYPLNYITVTFTLDLSTGNISAPTTTTAGGGGGTSGLQAAG